ncbi:hypothetical protein PHSY_003069 [Pseudozyma hubeiensis SY62]|uniref:Uncharacterized protein n=1 Tax=Pseudozyma hubeiensis (strain SY62) TaxID=1305764 RepID=R9P288_PSEHS|nr:hypothetical protein PHSY_003069 [Pseudozyma hubeiensis SY62]GAC95493.1 hypothetical protein PHSY_003069 [Pseudozyma hubeiensis SY62]
MSRPGRKRRGLVCTAEQASSATVDAASCCRGGCRRGSRFSQLSLLIDLRCSGRGRRKAQKAGVVSSRRGQDLHVSEGSSTISVRPVHCKTSFCDEMKSVEHSASASTKVVYPSNAEQKESGFDSATVQAA